MTVTEMVIAMANSDNINETERGIDNDVDDTNGLTYRQNHWQR